MLPPVLRRWSRSVSTTLSPTGRIVDQILVRASWAIGRLASEHGIYASAAALIPPVSSAVFASAGRRPVLPGACASTALNAAEAWREGPIVYNRANRPYSAKWRSKAMASVIPRRAMATKLMASQSETTTFVVMSCQESVRACSKPRTRQRRSLSGQPRHAWRRLGYRTTTRPLCPMK